jgi:hypothetical protein
MNAPQIRIAVTENDGLVIYVNSAGRDELVRLLSRLTPQDRHVHLEPFLATMPGDASWADVVLHEGSSE